MVTYVATNQAELWLIVAGFDDLLLLGETTDDDGHTFTIMAQSDEATWDNPIPVDVAVQRWMADGAVASTQGHDNRQPYFKVTVSADTAADLAAGEAALAKRANGPVLLKWVPPTGPLDTVPTVFEVWTWHLEHQFDLDRELRLGRMYGVRCTAKPWARSEELTSVDALPTTAAPTVTPIDTCASTTGWTGAPNTPTTSGGKLIESRSESTSGNTSRSLTRTGTVTGLGSTPYLIIDASVTGGTPTGWLVTVDGQYPTRVATIGTQQYFQLPSGMTSFSTLIIGVLITVSHSGTVALNVADVSATDVVGGIGSHKQSLRTIDVGGSVKTAGSILVASPDATTLGTVVVYTCPDTDSGYTPPLRGYRTSGNTVTADGTAVSGNHEALVTSGTPNGPITYTIPTHSLAEGAYAVVGRFNSSTTIAPVITVSAFVQGSPSEVLTGSPPIVGAGVYVWCVIGVLTLPPGPIPPESQLNTVVQLSATHPGTVTVDELYLFDMTHGALSLIQVGSSGTNLWIDAPDADPAQNRPAVYIGTADDRTDAFGAWYASILALGDHDLDPDGAMLFVVTETVNDAAVSATFYQRWHTHAGA